MVTLHEALDAGQQNLLNALNDAAANAHGSLDVRGIAAELRSEQDEEYLLVTIRAAAPSSRDAWPVDDVRAMRQALQEAASAAGVSERVVVLLATAEGTGSASARPESRDVPPRTR